jgi:hypothetical protein
MGRADRATACDPSRLHTEVGKSAADGDVNNCSQTGVNGRRPRPRRPARQSSPPRPRDQGRSRSAAPDPLLNPAGAGSWARRPLARVHVAGSSAWNSGMPGRDLTVDGARLRAGGTGAGAGGRQARIGRPENAQNFRTRGLARAAVARRLGEQRAVHGNPHRRARASHLPQRKERRRARA